MFAKDKGRPMKNVMILALSCASLVAAIWITIVAPATHSLT